MDGISSMLMLLSVLLSGVAIGTAIARRWRVTARIAAVALVLLAFSFALALWVVLDMRADEPASRVFQLWRGVFETKKAVAAAIAPALTLWIARRPIRRGERPAQG